MRTIQVTRLTRLASAPPAHQNASRCVHRETTRWLGCLRVCRPTVGGSHPGSAAESPPTCQPCTSLQRYRDKLVASSGGPTTGHSASLDRSVLASWHINRKQRRLLRPCQRVQVDIRGFCFHYPGYGQTDPRELILHLVLARTVPRLLLWHIGPA